MKLGMILFSKEIFKYIFSDFESVFGKPFTDPLLVWFRNCVKTLESNFIAGDAVVFDIMMNILLPFVKEGIIR